MPVMGGIDSTKNILELAKIESNKNNNFVEPHVVALTAHTNKNIEKECIETGMKKVLNKPVNIEAVHFAIHMHFHRISFEEYKKVFKDQFKKDYN